MENLIHIINKIHDAFSISSMPCEIDLPQIVVVGCQSAGKSSVLENIVGREFLPRGSGIVTRRPLVLQLFTSQEEYGQFLHSPKKFYNFNEIRQEIQAETNRTCGKEKTVSDVSINLKIYSPDVINLTLVDLPGLTKVAVGSQTEDIVRLIREMVLKFIRKENSLILAVSPANVDLANSDALQIAKEVDPSGNRTIGVITKLDMMDPLSNARDILENRVFPLRRGYVGVINRSQREIEQNMPIEAALRKETQFFKEHAAYRHMVDRMGTKFLQKYLNEQLLQHILHVLPNLNKKISEQLSILDSQVKEIEAKQGKMSHKSIMKEIVDFGNLISSCIMTSESITMVNTESLSVGATINRCFFKSLPLNMRKILDGGREELQNRIRMSIQNVHGVKTGLNTPDMAFEMIIKMEIEKSYDAVIRCLDDVYSFTFKNVEDNLRNLKQYPNLRFAVQEILRNVVDMYYKQTSDQLNLTITIHKNYINTNHPDFISNIANETTIEPLYVKKGYITVGNITSKGKGSGFYVSLTRESVSFFKDEEEKDKKFSKVPTKMRYKLHPEMLNNFMLTLYGNDDKETLFKDLKFLDLVFSTYDECTEWLSAFVEIGVVPYDSYHQTMFDLERSTKNVLDCVESYKRVYQKIINDVVPKVIYQCFLSQIVNYLKNELIGDLYSQGSIENLLKQSPDSIARNQEIMALHKATKEAKEYMRRILEDATMNTNNVYMPEPVFNSSKPGGRSEQSSSDMTSRAPPSGDKPPVPGRSSRRGVWPPENGQNSSEKNQPSVPARPRR